MNVLSLFDGISCGKIALDRLGIKISNYYASEIDKYAIKISKKNHPNIIHLGDVKNIGYNNGLLTNKDNEFFKVDIDLLIGGSPCKGFSFAGHQLNFTDPRSKLFFDYVRILKQVKPKYFLLENVKMKKEYQDIITYHLHGIEPIEINSALVSAQYRKRLYWIGKLQDDGTYKQINIQQPVNKNIMMKDILESPVDVDTKYYLSENQKQNFFHNKNGNCNPSGKGQNGNVYNANYKSPTITTNKGEGPKIRITKKIQKDLANKGNNLLAVKKTLLEYKGGIFRKLTPIECERLQNIYDNYTHGVSNTQRYKMIGNSWTVEIIEHIFKQMFIL